MRHLTEAAKLGAVEAWLRSLRVLDKRAEGEELATGDPDPEIVPWCLRLNAVPGVCTLQSCAGHREGEILSSGHVWLWLDRRMATACDERAIELARSPLIERVSRHYMSDGQEVFAVTFQGNERGSLAASMELVCTFIEHLSPSPAPSPPQEGTPSIGGVPLVEAPPHSPYPGRLVGWHPPKNPGETCMPKFEPAQPIERDTYDPDVTAAYADFSESAGCHAKPAPIAPKGESVPSPKEAELHGVPMLRALLVDAAEEASTRKDAEDVRQAVGELVRLLAQRAPAGATVDVEALIEFLHETYGWNPDGDQATWAVQIGAALQAQGVRVGAASRAERAPTKE